MEIVIIGAGDIGFHLAKRLSFDKHNITMIESDAAKVKNADANLDAKVIEGFGSSYKSLKDAQTDNADIFAALTNNDEVNILACRIAKKMGAKTTVARVRNPEFKSKDYIFNYEELGCDFIIQPEKQAANRIVRLIRQSIATDIVEFADGKIQFIGIGLDEKTPILNIPFKELGKKFAEPALRVLAIRRKQFTLIPDGDDVLKSGDRIYIIAERESMSEVLALFGKSEKKNSSILLVGGGLIGEYIAKELEEEMSLKIIEIDQAKAERLAEILPETLVIHGDGSDMDLLTEEGLADMDEFVAVSGNDEVNLITGMVAKHLRVPRTINLVRKMDYLPLTHTIGLDTIISKQYITVNAIQKFIRGRQVSFFAELPGINAEIIEFVAQADSKICKKPLMKIKFPHRAIVGAILKADDRLVIPKGATVIEPGDRVIVFSKPEVIKKVEKLF